MRRCASAIGLILAAALAAWSFAAVSQDAPDNGAAGAPAPAAAVDGSVSTDDMLIEPPLAQVTRTLVKPRFATFTRTSSRLQNLVLRRCSLGNRADRELEVVYVRTIRSASAAVALAFGSDYHRTASSRVLSVFSDVTIARTQFSVLLAGAQDGPATLAALRNLEPGYIGLPALEYVLFHLEEEEGRCRLAVTLAAHVATTARTMERRWDNRILETQWADTDTEPGARRRLFDLLSGKMWTLERTVNVLSPRPRGVAGHITFSEPANAAFIQGRLVAMTDMARLINAYAVPGSRAQVATNNLVQNLAALVDRSAELRQSPTRETAAMMTTQLSAIQQYVQTDVAAAFGFAPEALDTSLLDRVAPASANGNR